MYLIIHKNNKTIDSIHDEREGVEYHIDTCHVAKTFNKDYYVFKGLQCDVKVAQIVVKP
jgi:hypothetical protein